jgi:NAD-dependent SIR2 family protein deacetylase
MIKIAELLDNVLCRFGFHDFIEADLQDAFGRMEIRTCQKCGYGYDEAGNEFKIDLSSSHLVPSWCMDCNADGIKTDVFLVNKETTEEAGVEIHKFRCEKGHEWKEVFKDGSPVVLEEYLK